MSVKTEGVHALEFLLSEANGQRSREQVTIPSGQGALAAGTMLTSANEKAVDGASAVKVLTHAVDATSAAAEASVIARDAEVHGELLGWEDDTTATEKLAAATSLASVGILVRWTTVPDDSEES